MDVLFKELNANMIATDNRYTVIVSSHNALVASGSVFFTTLALYDKDYSFVIALIFSLYSAAVTLNLAILLRWKRHYIVRMMRVGGELYKDLSDDMLPVWMLNCKAIKKRSSTYILSIVPKISWAIWLLLAFNFSINNGVMVSVVEKITIFTFAMAVNVFIYKQLVTENRDDGSS